MKCMMISFMLEEELKKKVELLAHETERSRAWVIREALKKFLEREKNEKN